jgi:hypothetical protein
MNKKLFNDKLMKQIINKMPILIFIVVVSAYCFMNMNNFTGTQSMRGGGFTQFGGAGTRYPPGTPFLFQMRYLIYFLFIFLIVFNIYYAYQSSLVTNVSFYESGKVFLASFCKRTLDISNKVYRPVDPEAKEYAAFVTACGIDYEPFTKSFCTMFAPCSCCGVGDYNTTSPTFLALSLKQQEVNKALCNDVPKAVKK